MCKEKTIEEKKVLCIGGANVDRKIQVRKKLTFGTSNPAKSVMSSGGVARNIAENLGRMGVTTSLFALIGDDFEGEWLINKTKPYVDMETIGVVSGASTGTYTAVLDEEGEMAIALSDMDIYDVNYDPIEENWDRLRNTDVVLLDTNFPPEVIEKVMERCQKEKIPVCIATVSVAKTAKLPASLNGVTWLITNHKEAEALAQLEIETEGDFYRAAEIILEKGAERVVITRGEKGLIYFTKKGEAGALVPPKICVVDVTGAGDSLISGILFGYVKGLNTENSCKVGLTCSLITIQSKDTVSSELNQQKLIEAFQQHFSKGVIQQ